jgi:hypothetical protein
VRASCWTDAYAMSAVVEGSPVASRCCLPVLPACLEHLLPLTPPLLLLLPPCV